MVRQYFQHWPLLVFVMLATSCFFSIGLRLYFQLLSSTCIFSFCPLLYFWAAGPKNHVLSASLYTINDLQTTDTYTEGGGMGADLFFDSTGTRADKRLVANMPAGNCMPIQHASAHARCERCIPPRGAPEIPPEDTPSWTTDHFGADHADKHPMWISVPAPPPSRQPPNKHPWTCRA